jgi:hypothetical protein
LQVLVGEDKKSRLNDSFSVLASSCLAYDVISILQFLIIIKKNGEKLQENFHFLGIACVFT